MMMSTDSHSPSEIQEILRLKNVAVVGMSNTDGKPPVVDNAIKKKGIKVIWMQSGIYNKDAERKAKENGIDVVYNRCMKVEHSMLID
jgi:predicted CoA-binding protein